MKRSPRGPTSTSIVLVIISLIGLTLVGATSATADGTRLRTPTFEVVEWNHYAYQALVNAPGATVPGAGQAPLVASLHLAMVHGAVLDAVRPSEQSGGDDDRRDRRFSTSAAVAVAAHDVLIGVLKSTGQSPTATTRRLDELLAADLLDSRAADGNQAVESAIPAGHQAAAKMLEQRKNDGRFVPLPLVAGTDPGEWRPERPQFISDPNAWVSRVTPFTLRSAEQFKSVGPNRLVSAAYAKDFNEVKNYGGQVSMRSPEQESLAQFFDTNAVEIFNRTFREIAIGERLSLIEQARLFALLDTATADSLITCWAEKVKWGFWRPITAIHLADTDGNRRTAPDPTWMPRIDTPPYSDHTSGFNCISGAMMTSAQLYFGTDRMPFTMRAVNASGAVVGERTYSRFSDVIEDVIDVRVLHGVHFRTADVQGAKIGAQVARWVDRQILR